jgi:hypothetical protein
MRISLIVGVAVLVTALFVPSPRLVAPSTSAATASPRTVLAECFISRIDIFSPHVITQMQRLQQEEGQERLLVLAYFARELPCPSDNPLAQCPNPLTSMDSVARWDYYHLNCFPSVFFNGFNSSQPPPGQGGCWSFGDPRNFSFFDEPIYQTYRQYYQLVSRTTSPLQIALNGGIVMEAADQYRVDAQAVLTATDRVRGRSRIWFVLYENQVEALTRDGFGLTLVPTHYDWVVRRAINSGPLTIRQSGQQQMAAISIPLDPAWQRENLGIVVFVQGAEVIQSASLDIGMSE